MKSILIGALAAILAAGAQSNEAERQLKAAMNAELLNGDLKAAIKQYGEIAAKYKSDRAVAAMALVRMAEAYQKMGDAEASRTYERVVREFADQKEAVNIARARLGRNESAAGAKGDRPVWTGGRVDMFGRISPDGRYLTYVDWAQTGNLIVHDMVTATDHALTKKKSWDDGPGSADWSSISRNGKQVVYEWLDDTTRRYSLFLADFHGASIGEPRRLLGNDEISSIRPFDWSPDNKWIAVLVERSDRTSQIGLVSVPDGQLRVLRSVNWRGPENICFSSDGKFVVYDLTQDDNPRKHDVFSVAIDGSRGSTLVAHPADDRLVGFSRDGSHFLFSSDRAGSSALWVQPFADGKTLGRPAYVKPDFGSPWIQGLTADGVLYVTKMVGDSDVHFAPVDLAAGKLLAAPQGLQRFPSRGRPDWSADGKFLAFVDCGKFGGGPCTISIRNVETGQVRELRPALHYLGFPRWSPDGRSFFTDGTDLKGRRGVYLVDATSGSTTFITEAARGVAGWSADGRKVFLANRAGKVVEWDLATGSAREIISTPAGSWGITVSPDGRLAAYIIKESVLAVVPTSGGEPRELLRVQEPESLVRNVVLSWTLNGSALVVTKRLTSATRSLARNSSTGGEAGVRSELWLVPVSGGAPRKLDIDASSWDIVNPIGARFSPDGRYVAFMAGKREMEVWALEVSLPTKSASR
ncbi:MAG: PD40 domain-containing protein [Acidobacteria bacterium]|nr:PD40 domain-containing protein [Acidobacteriota bacterium]